ncbi:adenosine kinase [Microvirga sp. W0021]|uniref:Adenosine kinase n=1 Tax=Hohaiivirga grylli TaxID=3133970 RepID=A0ABV0BF77_9HYPH
MTNRTIDVLTIGNAIVDVLAQTDETFLVEQNLAKGTMHLIDEPRAEELYGLMRDVTVMSGGSAANTAAGIASLGSKAAFIGKVRNDELGDLYARDLEKIGVHYNVAPATDGPATARCCVLITPDGERTMNTYLGACQNLTVDDINPETIKASSIIYLEGYLWDPPKAKDAFRKAIDIAHQDGNRIALTLSDTFCVDRYRDEFLTLIRDGSIDILFANTHELRSLYQTADENTAIAAFRDENVLGVVTRSEEGALVIMSGETSSVPAYPVDQVVDATGAGDLFAAGFLAGMTQGLHLMDCARLGSLSASEAISHIGPRPQVSLRELAKANMLIA